jgi:hypothetical protein
MNTGFTYFRLTFAVSVVICSISLTMAQTDQAERASTATSGAISGRVVNDSGQPIPHATIYVSASVVLSQPRTTTTDEGGNFTVTNLDPYAYYVSAVVPSYINMPRDPDVPIPVYRVGDSVTINMLKGAVITGTLTNAAGDPIVRTAVRAVMVRDANGQEPVPARFPVERLTDDRGVYRIYGLPPGTYIISAGGRSNMGGGFLYNAYDTNAPTYAPAATRDTAAEINVRAGDEVTGIDIHFRGDVGHAISGSITNPLSNNGSNSVMLYQSIHGVREIVASSFQFPNATGFAFFGLPDGDYEMAAQSNSTQGIWLMSEPLRITMKGVDVQGLLLTLKPLASISGNVVLEASTAAECTNKRKPLLTETMISATRERKADDAPIAPNYVSGQTLLDSKGDFTLRNLPPGQFTMSSRFFAKYWYVSSIQSPGSSVQAGARRIDLARNGLVLKSGDRINGVTVTLAEGAASLRGKVKLGANESVPEKLYVRLLPSEREAADEVLRYFTVPVLSDASFSFNNIAPGKYWLVTQVAADTDSTSDMKLRSPARAELRTQLRNSANTNGTSVELKPCQNLATFELPLKVSKP